MKKYWYQSKATWGIVGAAAFTILEQFFPNPAYKTLIVVFLGWAGYGFRDAIK